MKPGTRFTDNGMELTVLRFAGNNKNNLALLICHDDGLFVTVRDLSRNADGSYSWSWGHYFSDLREALADYDERMT